MGKPFQARSPEELERFSRAPGFPVLIPDLLSRHPADAHWMIEDPAGKIVARCSLWWRTPYPERAPSPGEAPGPGGAPGPGSASSPFPGHRIGLLGHYAASGPMTAARLLQLACDQLAAHGCTLAVGPLDGNTWQRYRLLTERGTEPIFFLEPDNPDDWPAHFIDQGFTALAHYFSVFMTDLGHSDPRMARTAEQIADQGIQIRPLDLNRFEDELHRIYSVAVESFRHNFLYTPIREEDFVAQYRPFRPYLQPQLILLAEHQGRPVGFTFAVPDLLQARRGEAIDTLVFKTISVHPDCAGAGLGSLLVARCHQGAHRLGYTRSIHALIHQENPSQKIGSHYDARPIRRYALFGKELPGGLGKGGVR